MSAPALWSESIDRRILGAFVCVDAITGSSIQYPFPVSVPLWTINPNRSGVYVIFDGPGLNLLTTQFLPTGTWPAPVTFEVTLQDPNNRYLPRRANVQAPAQVPSIPPAPAGSANNPAAIAALSNPSTVFDPQRVELYPMPSAAIGPNWAAIHVSVSQTGAASQGLPWAVLRVVRTSDGTVLATGQTDANGQALVAVIGLTVEANTSGTGPVTLSTVAVTVTAYFDPGVLAQPSGWVPNPDDILSNLANPSLKSSSQPLNLGSGQELSMTFAITV